MDPSVEIEHIIMMADVICLVGEYEESPRVRIATSTAFWEDYSGGLVNHRVCRVRWVAVLRVGIMQYAFLLGAYRQAIYSFLAADAAGVPEVLGPGGQAKSVEVVPNCLPGTPKSLGDLVLRMPLEI